MQAQQQAPSTTASQDRGVSMRRDQTELFSDTAEIERDNQLLDDMKMDENQSLEDSIETIDFTEEYSATYNDVKINIMKYKLRTQSMFGAPVPPDEPPVSEETLRARMREMQDLKKHVVKEEAKLQKDIRTLNAQAIKRFYIKRKQDRLRAKFVARAKNLMYLGGSQVVYYGTMYFVGLPAVMWFLQNAHGLLGEGSWTRTIFLAGFETLGVPLNTIQKLDSNISAMMGVISTAESKGLDTKGLFTRAFNGKNILKGDLTFDDLQKGASIGKDIDVNIDEFQKGALNFANSLIDIFSPPGLSFLLKFKVPEKPGLTKAKPKKLLSDKQKKVIEYLKTLGYSDDSALDMVNEHKEFIDHDLNFAGLTKTGLKFVDKYQAEFENILAYFVDPTYEDQNFINKDINRIIDKFTNNTILKRKVLSSLPYPGKDFIPPPSDNKKDGIIGGVWMFFHKNITPDAFIGQMYGAVYDSVTGTIQSGLQALKPQMKPNSSDDDDEEREKLRQRREAYQKLMTDMRSDYMKKGLQGDELRNIMKKHRIIEDPEYEYNAQDMNGLEYTFRRSLRQVREMSGLKSSGDIFKAWWMYQAVLTGVGLAGAELFMAQKIQHVQLSQVRSGNKEDLIAVSKKLFQLFGATWVENAKYLAKIYYGHVAKTKTAEFKKFFNALYTEVYDKAIRKALNESDIMVRIKKLLQQGKKETVNFMIYRLGLSVYISEALGSFIFNALEQIRSIPGEALNKYAQPFIMNIPWDNSMDYMKWLIDNISGQNVAFFIDSFMRNMSPYISYINPEYAARISRVGTVGRFEGKGIFTTEARRATATEGLTGAPNENRSVLDVKDKVTEVGVIDALQQAEYYIGVSETYIHGNVRLLLGSAGSIMLSSDESRQFRESHDKLKYTSEIISRATPDELKLLDTPDKIAAYLRKKAKENNIDLPYIDIPYGASVIYALNNESDTSKHGAIIDDAYGGRVNTLKGSFLKRYATNIPGITSISDILLSKFKHGFKIGATAYKLEKITEPKDTDSDEEKQLGVRFVRNESGDTNPHITSFNNRSETHMLMFKLAYGDSFVNIFEMETQYGDKKWIRTNTYFVPFVGPVEFEFNDDATTQIEEQVLNSYLSIMVGSNTDDTLYRMLKAFLINGENPFVASLMRNIVDTRASIDYLKNQIDDELGKMSAADRNRAENQIAEFYAGNNNLLDSRIAYQVIKLKGDEQNLQNYQNAFINSLPPELKAYFDEAKKAQARKNLSELDKMIEEAKAIRAQLDASRSAADASAAADDDNNNKNKLIATFQAMLASGKLSYNTHIYIQHEMDALISMGTLSVSDYDNLINSMDAMLNDAENLQKALLSEIESPSYFVDYDRSLTSILDRFSKLKRASDERMGLRERINSLGVSASNILHNQNFSSMRLARDSIKRLEEHINKHTKPLPEGTNAVNAEVHDAWVTDLQRQLNDAKSELQRLASIVCDIGDHTCELALSHQLLNLQNVIASLYQDLRLFETNDGDQSVRFTSLNGFANTNNLLSPFESFVVKPFEGNLLTFENGNKKAEELKKKGEITTKTTELNDAIKSYNDDSVTLQTLIDGAKLLQGEINGTVFPRRHDLAEAKRLFESTNGEIQDLLKKMNKAKTNIDALITALGALITAYETSLRASYRESLKTQHNASFETFETSLGLKKGVLNQAYIDNLVARKNSESYWASSNTLTEKQRQSHAAAVTLLGAQITALQAAWDAKVEKDAELNNMTIDVNTIVLPAFVTPPGLPPGQKLATYLFDSAGLLMSRIDALNRAANRNFGVARDQDLATLQRRIDALNEHVRRFPYDATARRNLENAKAAMDELKKLKPFEINTVLDPNGTFSDHQTAINTAFSSATANLNSSHNYFLGRSNAPSTQFWSSYNSRLADLERFVFDAEEWNKTQLEIMAREKDLAEKAAEEAANMEIAAEAHRQKTAAVAALRESKAAYEAEHAKANADLEEYNRTLALTPGNTATKAEVQRLIQRKGLARDLIAGLNHKIKELDEKGQRILFDLEKAVLDADKAMVDYRTRTKLNESSARQRADYLALMAARDAAHAALNKAIRDNNFSMDNVFFVLGAEDELAYVGFDIQSLQMQVTLNLMMQSADDQSNDEARDSINRALAHLRDALNASAEAARTVAQPDVERLSGEASAAFVAADAKMKEAQDSLDAFEKRERQAAESRRVGRAAAEAEAARVAAEKAERAAAEEPVVEPKPEEEAVPPVESVVEPKPEEEAVPPVESVVEPKPEEKAVPPVELVVEPEEEVKPVPPVESISTEEHIKLIKQRIANMQSMVKTLASLTKTLRTKSDAEAMKRIIAKLREEAYELKAEIAKLNISAAEFQQLDALISAIIDNLNDLENILNNAIDNATSEGLLNPETITNATAIVNAIGLRLKSALALINKLGLGQGLGQGTQQGQRLGQDSAEDTREEGEKPEQTQSGIAETMFQIGKKNGVNFVRRYVTRDTTKPTGYSYGPLLRKNSGYSMSHKTFLENFKAYIIIEDLIIKYPGLNRQVLENAYLSDNNPGQGLSLFRRTPGPHDEKINEFWNLFKNKQSGAHLQASIMADYIFGGKSSLVFNKFDNAQVQTDTSVEGRLLYFAAQEEHAYRHLGLLGATATVAEGVVGGGLMVVAAVAPGAQILGKIGSTMVADSVRTTWGNGFGNTLYTFGAGPMHLWHYTDNPSALATKTDEENERGRKLYDNYNEKHIIPKLKKLESMTPAQRKKYLPGASKKLLEALENNHVSGMKRDEIRSGFDIADVTLLAEFIFRDDIQYGGANEPLSPYLTALNLFFAANIKLIFYGASYETMCTLFNLKMSEVTYQIMVDMDEWFQRVMFHNMLLIKDFINGIGSIDSLPSAITSTEENKSYLQQLRTNPAEKEKIEKITSHIIHRTRINLGVVNYIQYDHQKDFEETWKRRIQ